MDIGWLRNGQDIPDSEEFRYVSRGNLYQLVIAEIFPEDSGKYTCEALNDHGEADCQCSLNVIGKNLIFQFKVKLVYSKTIFCTRDRHDILPTLV